MPRFKTTQNIFNDFSEIFDENWMDSDELQLPPKKDWDYSRPLQIEDVDIWEVITEHNSKVGVYAAWSPYAEFYLIKTNHDFYSGTCSIETYYGSEAIKNVVSRCQQLNIPIPINKVWVNPEDMWIYENSAPEKLIIY